MHKPDQIGLLVLALFVFSLYTVVANVLTSLALASLPLGRIGSSWNGSTAIVMLGAFNAGVAYLYLIRQRKRAPTSPNPQK